MTNDIGRETADDCFVICPHCGHAHGDAWEWCKDTVLETSCYNCGAKFKCWAEHSVMYHALALKDEGEAA